jgi:peroxiredoxin
MRPIVAAPAAALLVLALSALAPRPAVAQEADPYAALIDRGIAQLDAKDYDGALATFRRAVEMRPDAPAGYYDMACVHAQRSDRAQAVAWLEMAMARGFRDEGHIARDADLDPVREDEAFRELMVRTFGRVAPPPPRPRLPLHPPGGGNGPARFFTLKGEPATLAAIDGKVALVLIWRSWAKPCRQVAAALSGLAAAHPGKGLVILGLSDEPADEQERVADELKVTYPLLRYEGALPAPLFEDVRDIFPTLVVVDRAGKVRATLIGARTREELEAVLEPLIGPPAVPRRAVF